MATQLGNFDIYEISGTTIKGSYESIYEKNVGHGSRYIATQILIDAWESLGLDPPKSISEPSYDSLASSIVSCLFETPRRKKTNFTITVTDPDISASLSTGAWESYLIG